MKITDMHVDGFGVWNSLSVKELNEGMTLFYGPNEAGKTTLMQFVRTVLYGFSEERRTLYLPPVHGGVPGGMIRARSHSGEYVVERRLTQDEDGNPAGRVIVLSDSGKRQGQHLLDVLLSGVDESIFNNVFAIGIRELQELATLNDTQAAEHLYNLASGVDRVSLVEVMRELDVSRRRILDASEQTCELTSLHQQQQKLQSEIAELRQQTRRWMDLAKQRIALAEEVGQLEANIVRFDREARVVEIAVKVRDKWRGRSDTNKELRVIGHVEPLPAGCLPRLDELNVQLEQQREKIKPLDLRRRQVRRELAAQPINKPLWEQSSRIEAVCEYAPWIASLDGQIERVEKQLGLSEKDLAKQEEKLASDSGLEFSSTPIVSPRIVEQLNGPARVLTDCAKKRSLAKRRKRQIEQRVDETAGQLKEELAERKKDDLGDALQQGSDLVKNLRRRVQMEDRMEQMLRLRQELEGEHNDLLDDQLTRVRVLGVVGLMFVFGMVLLLCGIFGDYYWYIGSEIRWGIGLMGGLCIFVSIAWKVVVERTERDEFENCSERRRSLDMELERASTERDELEQLLPSGSGPYSSRLVTAERELKELEAMAPLEEDRRDAHKKSQSAKNRESSAADEFREARNRWRRALQHAGLPATLTPKHVRRLAVHYHETEKLRATILEHQQKLDQLRFERAAMVDRICQLTRDVGLATAGEDPHVQLTQLSSLLSSQREITTKRRELVAEERGLRKSISQEGRRLRLITRSREALFAATRVADEVELRDRTAKLEEIARLSNRLQEFNEQVATIIAGFCGEDEVEKELAANDPPGLKQRRETLTTRLQESQSRLAALHQRRGEINQEMKSLTENKRLDQARLELACVEHRIQLATQRWQKLASTLQMLEVVRDTYEAERQPETLGEASDYLEQFTDGKYARIWTPLGSHVLRVDDKHGTCLTMDLLSRGTREAVFLSLRLALVAAYARRGIQIPLVLDDVLVNLDGRRTEAAVRTLNEFASKGHQLLFFTCHDHIQAMFHRHDVDVRLLPSNLVAGSEAKSMPKPQPAPAFVEVAPVHEPVVDLVSVNTPPVELETPPAPVVEEPDEVFSLAEDEASESQLDDELEYRLADDDTLDNPRPAYDLVENWDEEFSDDGLLWWESPASAEKGEAAA